MPLSRRLADLEETLDSLYETLGKVQKRLDYANDIFEQDSIEKRIRKELLPRIREREAEYWRLLAQEASLLKIDEADASNAVVEVVHVVEVVQQNNQYPEKITQLLTEIRNKLTEPGKSSSAKLKAAIPLFPFFSLEMEADTEGLLRRIFPTFSRLLKGTTVSKSTYAPHQQGEMTASVGTSREIRIQQEIEVLQAIINDARSNPNLVDVRERFGQRRKEISDFLSQGYGTQVALNLAMISPRGDTERSRLLNEVTQILNYLIALSKKV